MHILAHTPLGAMQSLLRFLPLTAASGRRCSARNVWTGPRRATTCRLGRPDGADAGPSTARVTLLTDEEAAAAALPAALQADLRRKQTATVHRAGPEPQRLVYVGLGGAGQLSAAGYRKAAVQAVAALRAAKCMAADIEVTGSNSQETLGVRRLHLNFLHFGFAGCQQAILTQFPFPPPPPFHFLVPLPFLFPPPPSPSSPTPPLLTYPAPCVQPTALWDYSPDTAFDQQTISQSVLLSNYHFDKYLAPGDDAPHLLQVAAIWSPPSQSIAPARIFLAYP